MNNQTNFTSNNTNGSWEEHSDGPSLHTRIALASAWVFIAVVGIIGKEKNLFFLYIYLFFQFLSIGNSLVIFVAIRFEKFSNVTNCFIVNRELKTP